MTAIQFPLDTPLLRSAAAIVKVLRDHNFEAYFVGGCVRDLVMGRVPKDVDIATSATPDVVQEIFPSTVAVGESFGVVIVLREGIHFEVATFRSDNAYSDGRRPDSVSYSASAAEDSRRRDFTINALFYDPLEARLLDFHGGRDDIERKIVRAIGSPGERFREDKLRMLRAVRFAARFGFMIEAGTRQAIVDAAAEIKQVSAERQRDELTRILTEGHSQRGFRLLDDLGVLAYLLPEVRDLKGVEQPPEFHPEGDVWEHTMLLLHCMDETKKEVSGVGGQASGKSMEGGEPGSQKLEVRGQKPDAKGENSEVGGRKSETAKGRASAFSGNWELATGNFPLPWNLSPVSYPTPLLAWAALLHDIGKPATFRRAPDRIRFDGHVETGARMARQIGRRFRMSNEETEAIAELVLDHLRFKDVQKMRPSTLKRFVRREQFAEHLELHRLDCLACHGNLEAYYFTRAYAQTLTPEEARPKPFLTGSDLIDLGYAPGPEFKKILTALEDAQLENQIKDRESALEYLQRRFPPGRGT
ncbi:MAG: HDIG domain-containing protein [Acidobacteriia bacterium]|nr:HDIG domain-containing protein [Terriglobia bacterium]